MVAVDIVVDFGEQVEQVDADRCLRARRQRGVHRHGWRVQVVVELEEGGVGQSVVLLQLVEVVRPERVELLENVLEAALNERDRLVL